MEDEILALPRARAEFTNLSEAEVRKAIEDGPWLCNPITAEVTRLVAQGMGTLNAHFTQHGYATPRLLRIGVQCPIEKVAVLIVVRFVEGEAGAGCPFIFH